MNGGNMNIYEFIEITRKEPMSWIQYCEIIIEPTGNIILARPSHEQAIVAYAMKKENKTRDEIYAELLSDCCLPVEWFVDKYKLIAVWYSGYMCHIKGPNRFQKKVIELLQKEGLVESRNPHIRNATEYTDYFKRQEIKKMHQV